MEDTNFVWAVITEANEDDGNMADEPIWVDFNGIARSLCDPFEIEKCNKHNIQSIKTQVFHKGELLVLDSEYGREISGMGRKPSKWCVSYEIFPPEKYIDAVKLAKSLKSW